MANLGFFDSRMQFASETVTASLSMILRSLYLFPIRGHPIHCVPYFSECWMVCDGQDFGSVFRRCFCLIVPVHLRYASWRRSCSGSGRTVYLRRLLQLSSGGCLATATRS